MTIAEIKRNQFVFNHLRKAGIWINYNEIKSHDTTQVGWLENHNPEHYSGYYIAKAVKKILPDHLHEYYQINIRQVQYYASDLDPKKRQKIYTRAFVLEMDRSTSREYSDEIYSTFNNHNTLLLVPMNSAFDLDGIFKQKRNF